MYGYISIYIRFVCPVSSVCTVRSAFYPGDDWDDTGDPWLLSGWVLSRRREKWQSIQVCVFFSLWCDWKAFIKTVTTKQHCLITENSICKVEKWSGGCVGSPRIHPPIHIRRPFPSAAPFPRETAVCFLHAPPLFMSPFQRSERLSLLAHPGSYLHTYLHSKTSRSFPLNFQETSCFPSSVSRTALTLFPFKLQDKHTHTHTHTHIYTYTAAFIFKQPSLIRNVGNNVMSASIGHFSPTSKSHVGSNPHQSLADATTRAGATMEQ